MIRCNKNGLCVRHVLMLKRRITYLVTDLPKSPINSNVEITLTNTWVKLPFDSTLFRRLNSSVHEVEGAARCCGSTCQITPPQQKQTIK